MAARAEKRPDSEAYSRAAAIAREVREQVADQLHDLVIESEAMGSHSELVTRVQRVGVIAKQVVEARGRHQQAREMGLPLAPSVEAEREAMVLLRHATMALGAAAGLWAAAMDYEARRPSDLELNGVAG